MRSNIIFRLPILMICFLLSSCKDYHFNYKRNPIHTLVSAHKAIMKRDVKNLTKYLSLEAKCLYANLPAVDVLREELSGKFKHYHTDLKLVSSKFNKSPRYVGYWSYYNQIYQAIIFHGSEPEKAVAQFRIACDFGYDGVMQLEEATESNINKMPIKRCKIQKVTGELIDQLVADPECKDLRVSFN